MSEPSAARTFTAKLLSVADECAGVKTFELSVPDDFVFIPGMWVMVAFPDAPKHTRAYSISSSALHKGSIEISFNKVGDFTARMFELKTGEELLVTGPYGKWRYRESDPHAVLISGGTGLTPFRAMGRTFLDKKLNGKMTILYSAKTPQDILYAADLERFKAAGIDVHVTLTRASNNDWSGPAGRLTIETVKTEVDGWEAASYYLCGPKTMVSEFTHALEGAGIPRERIHYEKWGDY